MGIKHEYDYIYIIGDKGYIGSRMVIELAVDYNIHHCGTVNDIDFQDFKKCRVIIMLCGKGKCNKNDISTIDTCLYETNKLVSLVQPWQKLVYASSSSLYANHGYIEHNEDDGVYSLNNYYDMSKYTSERLVTQNVENHYILRLGTVNGWSPMMKYHSMMNKMVSDLANGYNIIAFNSYYFRPILGMNDLKRVLCTIINSDTDCPGIYNITSFNDTIGGIANKLVRENMYRIIRIVQKDFDANFSTSTLKFEKAFNFEFQDTVKSITLDIIQNENIESISEILPILN